MSESGGEYIHGTDPDEQRRLSLLNELMNETSLRRLSLTGGERVLDVGSGLGQLTSEIAKAVGPKGRVVGIERHEAQLTKARENASAAGVAERIEFRQGSAMKLPLEAGEWASFDVVHTRFLLEHLRDPQAVVDGMTRAARSGGRIILEDDDHDLLRMWPEPDGVYAVWRAYIKSYEVLENDPFVGRKLVALLHAAGAEPIDNHWNFFGSCAGNKTFPGFVENFIGVIRGARDTVLSSSAFTPSEFDDAVASLEEWGKRPDAALWYCTFWAQGRKP